MATKSELLRIKREIIVAWIFAYIVLIAWIVCVIYAVMVLASVVGIFGPSTLSTLPIFAGSVFLGSGIVFIIIILILMIPAIVVYRRINRMRIAVDKENYSQLKKLNSIGWAIVAIIFSGIIPGIMLIIAHGPIKNLEVEEFEQQKVVITSVAPMAFEEQRAETNKPFEPPKEESEKLAKLKSLFDSELITKEKYEQQKAKILSTTIPESSTEEIEKLTKLKSLLDSGLISKEEFDQQKAKIFQAQPVAPKQEPKIEEQLKMLKSLLDSGTITQAEYENLRKKVLEKL
jgi:uncharacterized protein YqgQ